MLLENKSANNIHENIRRSIVYSILSPEIISCPFSMAIFRASFCGIYSIFNISLDLYREAIVV